MYVYLTKNKLKIVLLKNNFYFYNNFNILLKYVQYFSVNYYLFQENTIN